MTPDTLDKIEQLHNDGFTSQEIVDALKPLDGWLVQGATGFHDGISYGVAGSGWTRANAKTWNRGWAAAAKHSGLRKVVLADCGKDDRDCTECGQEQGDWHYMGCGKLEADTAPTPITLPGTLHPDLLRKCSPVVISVRDQPLQRGVVGQLYPPTLLGLWVHGEPSQTGRTKYGTAEVINRGRLSLDLEDETGRAHAERWLGAQLGLPPRLATWAHLVFNGESWCVEVDESRWAWGTFGDEWQAHVPALGDLVPEDSTLLLDGSRRSVALALQAVCLHVGGGR